MTLLIVSPSHILRAVLSVFSPNELILSLKIAMNIPFSNSGMLHVEKINFYRSLLNRLMDKLLLKSSD